MENNFKCPETGKEYYFPKYIIKHTTTGLKYFDKDSGKEIQSEESVPLIPIERKKGFTTTVYGDFNSQVQKREKFFRERAKKHSQSFDAKDEKIHRTNQEMGNFLNKKNGNL